MASGRNDNGPRRRKRISHAEIRRRDRRRQKEERKKLRRRRRSHKRKMRQRQWEDVKKSLINTFRGSEERRKHRHARNAMKRRIRQEKAEERQQQWKNLAVRLGLKSRKITEQDIIKRKIRQERRQEFKNAIANFFKNPLPKKREKDLDEIVIRRKIKEDRINTVIKGIRRFFINLNLIMKNPESGKKYLVMMMNSTVLYVVSFLIVYFLYHFITMLTAASFDIPTEFRYFKLTFPISTYSNLWTRPALVIIFAAGPLLSLIIALLLLRLFYIRSSWMRHWRILMLWMALHGINMFFGAYIVGMITRTGFIYTSEWIFYSSKFDIEEIIFALIAFFVLVISGRYATRLFLLSSLSRSLIKPSFRAYYILARVIFPFLIGSVILILTFMPHNPPYILLFYATMFIMVFQTLTNFNASFNERVLPIYLSKKTILQWGFLILMLVLLIAYRVGLEKGLTITV
ncbi:MAG: hypothetical protein K9I94_13860 [Bacteroidales bacterium]|nr:hypothetical protein [Bacteroidales bacterium]